MRVSLSPFAVIQLLDHLAMDGNVFLCIFIAELMKNLAVLLNISSLRKFILGLPIFRLL
jgi:hypothetical protein